jgi:hypothetical protein
VRVWSEILNRIPNARLVIDSGAFKTAPIQELFLERFAAHGIKPERIDIGYHTPGWEVLKNTDISLDCFPHNSGTTLIESLYMGVPFITLAGRPSVGRVGSTILYGAGHPEWIAHTEEDYIKKYNSLSPNGYNVATGGKTNQSFLGKTHSEETRKLLSENAKKQNKDPEVRERARRVAIEFNKTHDIGDLMRKSEKWQKALEEGRIGGHAQTEEGKKKISESLKKYHHYHLLL